jgi:2-polyprenyl-3-methyl-5-hydroxy-6-metoxy-1,4-benzoquinol methylase
LVASADKSNGYEGIAPIFISGRGRNRSGAGASVVAEWSQSLASGATILDLGCGTGIPISLTLVERGFNVYGVDASGSMIAEYRANFPAAPVQCAAVEDSDFFSRTFDGVVAWGLFFLLGAEAQRELIAKIAAASPRGGRLLFTAPDQACSWQDAMTERTSISLGHEGYRSALESEGMSLIATYLDKGQNHHYSALKR